MSGTTTHGWPYVTPDDHPLEFPTHSQSLANKLEQLIQAGSTARTAQGAGDVSQFVNVAFSPAFAAVPAVQISIDGDSTCGGVTIAIDSLTASGFTIRRMNTTAATKTYGVRWLAVAR